MPLQVCVPIAADEAAYFDPETVPTVGRLLTELGSKPAGQPTQKVRRNLEIAPAVHLHSVAI